MILRLAFALFRAYKKFSQLGVIPPNFASTLQGLMPNSKTMLEVTLFAKAKEVLHIFKVRRRSRTKHCRRTQVESVGSNSPDILIYANYGRD